MIIITTCPARIRQSIEHKPRRPTTCSGKQRDCAVDNVTRSFSSLQDNADSLNEGSHEQGVAHGQDRRAINHNAIVQAYRFRQQFAKTWATENFCRIWGATPPGKDVELPSRSGKISGNPRGNTEGGNLRFQNVAGRASNTGFAHQTIDNAG